jgi:hypothetical protein
MGFQVPVTDYSNDTFTITTQVTGSKTIAWSKSAGATSYEIQVFNGTDSTKAPVFTKKGLTTISYPVPPLPAGETYYWRVRAINGFGESAWSNLTLVKADTSVVAPVKPSGVAPTSPEISIPGTVTINPATNTIKIYPEVVKPVMPTEGTVTVNPTNKTVTINPGAGASEAQKEMVLLTDKELYDLIIENNLVPQQPAKGVLGWLLGIGKGAKMPETIGYLQDQYGLKRTGGNSLETQNTVYKLIANQKPTEGTVTVNPTNKTVTINPGAGAGEIKIDQGNKTVEIKN